ncbi:MAG: DUF4139 domain-containing protein, partial [Planctomycetota bacterium]
MISRFQRLAWGAACLLASGVTTAAPAGETTSTAADQSGVAVTIYNDDLALVRDTRRVRLERERNRLAWREVAAQMHPETARLRNLSNPAGLHLLEQDFDF